MNFKTQFQQAVRSVLHHQREERPEGLQSLWAQQVVKTGAYKLFEKEDHPPLWKVFLALAGWTDARSHLTCSFTRGPCPTVWQALVRWASGQQLEVFGTFSYKVEEMVAIPPETAAMKPRATWQTYQSRKAWHAATGAVSGILLREESSLPEEERPIVGALLYNTEYRPVFRAGDFPLRRMRVTVPLYRRKFTKRKPCVSREERWWTVSVQPQEENLADLLDAWSSDWDRKLLVLPEVEELFTKLKGDPMIGLLPSASHIE